MATVPNGIGVSMQYEHLHTVSVCLCRCQCERTVIIITDLLSTLFDD